MIIKFEPIGLIHTSYNENSSDVPIQGRMHPETCGIVEIYEKFIDGICGIESFSHLYLLYYLHRRGPFKLKVKPFAGNSETGIFSCRHPDRPNHIGLTLVENCGIEGNIISIRGVDVLDCTPLLDIKPYNPAFDSVDNVKTGWMTDDEKFKKVISFNERKK